MKLALQLFMFLLLACSHNSKNANHKNLADNKKNFEGVKKRPEWLNNPYKQCLEMKDICIVADGSSRRSARNQAFKQIAKIFETKISVKTVSNQTSVQKNIGETIIAGEVYESVSDEIEQITDQVMLKGVRFKEFYEDGEIVYVLAALNKRVSAEVIVSELNSIDDKMKSMLSRKKRSEVYPLKKLFIIRDRLNQRLIVLDGRGRIPPVKYSEILKLRNASKNYRILLDIKSTSKSKLPNSIKGLITKSLTDSNYKVIYNGPKGTYYKVVGNFSTNEQFMKVKGFVKYGFTLNLASENKNGEKIGNIVIKTTQMGRSYQHALDKAIKKIEFNLLEEDQISGLELPL